jgi:adsorption protein B
MVYGPLQGLLSIPRLIVGNILNGLATYRALAAFALSRQGRAAVKWDNTQHLEGVGDLHGEDDKATRATPVQMSVEEIVQGLRSTEIPTLVAALAGLSNDVTNRDRVRLARLVRLLGDHTSFPVRAAVARTIGDLGWPELIPVLMSLVKDREYVVRSNSARAILRQTKFPALLEQAFYEGDPYACAILIKSLEQDVTRQRHLFTILARQSYPMTLIVIREKSSILRKRYDAWVDAGGADVACSLVSDLL